MTPSDELTGEAPGFREFAKKTGTPPWSDHQVYTVSASTYSLIV